MNAAILAAIGGGALTAIGGAIALLLLGIGVVLGIRIGRRRAVPDDMITQQDRERMLQLLKELGSWTSEYSGNVSDYQDRLGELTVAVQQSQTSAQAETRVLMLLKQIMESNDQLQTRLDAAEKQLEKQTQQIESYLTEARTDGLTGLANRRAFDRKLDELFATYQKGGRSFVLALVDIDHFKSINDNHGHPVGDQVLRHLARTLKSQLDDAIQVARYGGEEFAILMNGPLQIAAAKMNETRKTVADERADFGDGLYLGITVSVGLSEPREDVLIGPIVRRADESLYAAKNIGRNRVYYHDGRGPTLVGAPEVARSEPT